MSSDVFDSCSQTLVHATAILNYLNITAFKSNEIVRCTSFSLSRAQQWNSTGYDINTDSTGR
jgi:hypothetical protein